MGERLALNLPTDPVRALAVRRWADEKGIELVELVGPGEPVARYPKVCRRLHQINGPEDEVASGKCKLCDRRANREYHARQCEMKKATRER